MSMFSIKNNMNMGNKKIDLLFTLLPPDKLEYKSDISSINKSGVWYSVADDIEKIMEKDRAWLDYISLRIKSTKKIIL